MYSSLKNIILKLVPRKALFRIEYPIRYFYSLGYTGNKYQCNICEKNLSHFIPLGHDTLCPRCGSIQRTRRLYQLLKDEFLKDDIDMLDFSPSRSMYRKLKNQNFNYTGSDLSGDFLSDASYDITNISCNDESFDVITCYHVLEHVIEDEKAMSELYRVLKKGGVCIIQTPFKQGEMYEDYSITTPEEREKHFGQNDHVRVYSAKGLKERLEKAGFKVDVRIFQESKENKNSICENETVLVCSK